MNHPQHYCRLCAVAALMAAMWSCVWAAAAPPALSDVSTLWPRLSPPATHAEVMDWARRLELTSEQIIAAERLHATYLDDAFALRQRANDVMIALDPAWMLVPEIAPIESDWRRMLATRRSYQRDLAQRDDLLVAQIGETLTEAQQAMLSQVQLRRARQRMLADGFVMPWLGSAPAMEIRDLLDELDLTADQRAAAEPVIAEYESKSVRTLQDLLDRLHEMRESWVKIAWRIAPHDGKQQPAWEAFQPTMVPPGEPVRALLNDEYEAMDRLKTVLPQDAWRRLAMKHAVAAGSWGPDSSSALVAIDFALKLADITDEQRQSLQTMRDEYAPRYDEAAFESARGFRRQQWTNPIVLGPGNYGRFVTNDEFRALIDGLNSGGQGYASIGQECRARFDQFFGEERHKQIREAISAERDRLRQQREREAASDAGNLVTYSWDLRSWELVSDQPSWDLMQRAAVLAGATATQIDVLRALHQDHAVAVQAAVARVEEAVQSANKQQFRPDWADRARDMAKAAADVVAEIAAFNSTFDQSIHEALKDSHAADRAWVLGLLRQWEFIASGPANFPPSLEFGGSSRGQSLTTLLDRVNAIAIVLHADMDDSARWTALEVLRNRTPPIADAAQQLRLAVPAAFSHTMLYNAESHMLSNERTQDDWKRFEQIQKDASASSLDAFAKRRNLMKSIGEALAAAEEAIADEASRNAFHEGIGRAAYPIAWNSVRLAAGSFERAERAPDLTEAQRSAVHDAAIMHAAAMREAARQVERLLDAYSQTDAQPHDARCRAALLWAPLEQALLQLTEQAAAAQRILRPILTPQQMRIIEESL